jgi:putative transposase
MRTRLWARNIKNESMATFRRAVVPGATYLFTVNTHQRMKVLTNASFYSALKHALRRVNVEHPFTTDASVLLPDHLHCIWTLPPGDANYALRWNLIKRLVSQATRQLIEALMNRSRQQRRELGLWQRRFWEHQIRDEQDLIKHVEYIHWNPVKHGYVARVRDWPYSSFHGYVKQGLYPLDWASSDEANKTAEEDYGEPL